MMSGEMKQEKGGEFVEITDRNFYLEQIGR